MDAALLLIGSVVFFGAMKVLFKFKRERLDAYKD